jgi:penicillin-binding protein 1C
VGRRPALIRGLAGVLATGTLAIALWVLTAWWAPLPARLSSAGSTVVVFADGSTAHVFLAPDDRWRIGDATVDPAYVDALLRYEDKRFWWHWGTDPVAVVRAVVVNLTAGRVRTGASTITSQLVRVLEPRPRSVWSKVVESHRALTLELRLDKQQILSNYLTFAPYGGNLEGVEAASLAYFGHSADALAADEIAVLLAVPQNPTARRPSVAHREVLRDARDGIGRFLHAEGVFDDVQLATVERSAVPTALRRFPRHAPHLATTLARRHAPGARIETTLDRGVQTVVEDLVALERERLERKGIANGAVVVVEHDTRAVRAVVGNLGFLEEGDGLQIPAFDVARSPGSTLKPFLYAMALDEGRLFPESLVTDLPVSWQGYAPKNYDERYRGLVRIEDALSQSLNVPFVQLLADLGVEPFLGKLRAMGADELDRRPGHYGLSLAAGGVELSPLTLAGLYATLAADGRYAPLRLQPSPEAPSVPVFSPTATRLTARALRLRDRPDFPSRRLMSTVPPHLAWKTGTSFGHRDAWAAGFGARMTAVVWLGNLDYRPARALLGSEAAGPLLFDVLEAVDGRQLPEEPPDDRVAVEVCAYSGMLPGDACPHRTTAYAPRTSVPTATCSFHVRRSVDTSTGEALSASCRTGRPWEERDYLVWPATVRRYLADRHGDLPPPPPWAAGCAPGDAEAPVITSPEAGQIAVLIPGVAPEEQEVPLAADAAPDARLSWFVDGTFLGTFPAEERVWWTPTVGEHRVWVADAAGRGAERRFRVRRP